MLHRSLVLVLFAAACGTDGTSYLTDVTDEAPGGNCAAGGVKIVNGADDDGDGTLSPAEIEDTKYVCSGIAGASSLSLVSPEAPGTNCAAGGARIDNGIDDNKDGTLQAGEIDDTTYVCGAGAAQILKGYDPNLVVAASSGAATTIMSLAITVPGAGKLLAISNVDAYCTATQCPAGNPAADGYLWLSGTDTDTSPALDYEYFYLTPNTTEGLSRTQTIMLNSAATYTVYLRGMDNVNQFAWYRPSITLVYLP